MWHWTDGRQSTQILCYLYRIKQKVCHILAQILFHLAGMIDDKKKEHYQVHCFGAKRFELHSFMNIVRLI